LSKLFRETFCGHPSLEVDDSGDAAVVVVDVDGAHHLLALEVPDAQPNPADGVAPAQFHQLRAARKPMSRISILTIDICKFLMFVPGFGHFFWIRIQSFYRIFDMKIFF
jgi:hypothetical protein